MPEQHPEISFEHERTPKCSRCGGEVGADPLNCFVCERAAGPEAYKTKDEYQRKLAKKFGLKPRN